MSSPVVPEAVQYAINARVYHARGVERLYYARTLTVVETTVLLKYQPAFAQRDVLDIGVGTGRTSAYLVPLARHYEGVDYSPVMVRHMQATMPHVSVRLADMRNLAEFPERSFDFVLAPDNVIDAVGHEDRLHTLNEIRRVLRSGGLFVFSSHNQRYERAQGGPKPMSSRNPVTQAVYIVQWLQQIVNHRRVGKLRVQREDYALLNDEGHDFACLHYYVGHATQQKQLSGAGFDALEVFDENGRSLSPDETAISSPSLTYVTRRRD